MYESSPFSSAQAPYLEALFERFIGNPTAVPVEWRTFFERLGTGATDTVRLAKSRPPAPLKRGQPAAKSAAVEALAPSADAEKQSAVSRLIQFYANRGHLIPDIDPLGLMQRPMPRVREPPYVGLADADMEAEFYTGSRTAGVEKRMKLREILVQMRQIYAGRIGAEFAHVTEADERLWLQDRFQDGHLQQHFTREEKLNLIS
jgi:2-oxoglutarate dehydrogenase E1 component